jgi:hypothetical protein
MRLAFLNVIGKKFPKGRKPVNEVQRANQLSRAINKKAVCLFLVDY